MEDQTAPQSQDAAAVDQQPLPAAEAVEVAPEGEESTPSAADLNADEPQGDGDTPASEAPAPVVAQETESIVVPVSEQPVVAAQPEYKVPYERFKQAISLARYTPALWKDEHNVVVDEYLATVSTRKLFVFCEAPGNLVLQKMLPSGPVDEVMYFIRDANDHKPRIALEDFERRVQYGTISGSSLDSLLRLMQGVYLPLFLDNRAWPDNVRKEFANQLHKFMAFLTDTTYQQQGHTVLYVPNESISSVAEAAHSKDLVQRLEALLLHWTRQIKEVVNNQHTSEAADNSGPLEEVQFWRSRCDDLSGISKQLNRADVKQIIDVLTVAKSTYLEQFLRLANMYAQFF
jgi:dynein heavy chain